MADDNTVDSVAIVNTVNPQDDITYKRKSVGKKIVGFLWDSLDEKSLEEHRLVRRLDSCYLIWACFYYFVMYLDSSTWEISRLQSTNGFADTMPP